MSFSTSHGLVDTKPAPQVNIEKQTPKHNRSTFAKAIQQRKTPKRRLLTRAARAQKVTLKTAVQRGNRVQIPKFIRWQFKMEPNQVLKVGINASKLWTGWQFFYAKMTKDGRINIPKLMLALLQDKKPSLEGYIIEITLEPA